MIFINLAEEFSEKGIKTIISILEIRMQIQRKTNENKKNWKDRRIEDWTNETSYPWDDISF